MAKEAISGNVKQAYDEFYKQHDEAWRMLGAKYKAEHIIDVSKGYTFRSVLEVGAGDGSVLQVLSDAGFGESFDAVEISESGVSCIRGRAIPRLRSVQVFDGYHLPFGDDSFDLIILSHVLEHVEHERLLLQELKRVASHCVIEVPRDYRAGVDKRIKHFLSYGHINVYTPTSLRYLLKTVGFEILAEMTSMIPPGVTRFNTYNNQKKKRSLLMDIRIYAEYLVRKGLARFFGRRKAESLANAYTVLCRRTAAAEIF